MKNIFKCIVLSIFFMFYNSAFASRGLILSADNSINYYENGELIRKVIQLPSSNYSISYTGDNFFYAKYFKEDKKYSLHICNLLTAKCNPIETPKETAEIVDISFSDNGYGLIARTDNKIDIYFEGSYSYSIPIEGREIKGVSFVGDYFYVLQVKENRYNWISSSIKKCSLLNLICSDYIQINQQITSIFSNEQNDIFALSKDGYIFYFFNGQYQWQKKFINYYADNLSFTDQGFVIRQQYTEKINNILQPSRYTASFFLCSIEENYCEKIQTTNTIPVKGSFK
ncbi:hypothetical protein QEJ31_12745 [Pigmentibacter sp. JX0631]|uniref:hypothetical protein n=1 Tax=Pigmentibacter sp. JX0631 TaxID=2976982 RepID=UPI002468FCE6|nr:hypothetical protein [Pigmentibacter sp. JX0631]WGL59392.1 hypothetical protein QEJ31_12745 [Pigmentibacter sp. JX0631]